MILEREGKKMKNLEGKDQRKDTMIQKI